MGQRPRQLEAKILPKLGRLLRLPVVRLPTTVAAVLGCLSTPAGRVPGRLAVDPAAAVLARLAVRSEDPRPIESASLSPRLGAAPRGAVLSVRSAVRRQKLPAEEDVLAPARRPRAHAASVGALQICSTKQIDEFESASLDATGPLDDPQWLVGLLSRAPARSRGKRPPPIRSSRLLMRQSERVSGRLQRVAETPPSGSR